MTLRMDCEPNRQSPPRAPRMAPALLRALADARPTTTEVKRVLKRSSPTSETRLPVSALTCENTPERTPPACETLMPADFSQRHRSAVASRPVVVRVVSRCAHAEVRRPARPRARSAGGLRSGFFPSPPRHPVPTGRIPCRACVQLAQCPCVVRLCGCGLYSAGAHPAESWPAELLSPPRRGWGSVPSGKRILRRTPP